MAGVAERHQRLVERLGLGSDDRGVHRCRRRRRQLPAGHRHGRRMPAARRAPAPRRRVPCCRSRRPAACRRSPGRPRSGRCSRQARAPGRNSPTSFGYQWQQLDERHELVERLRVGRGDLGVHHRRGGCRQLSAGDRDGGQRRAARRPRAPARRRQRSRATTPRRRRCRSPPRAAGAPSRGAPP